MLVEQESVELLPKIDSFLFRHVIFGKSVEIKALIFAVTFLALAGGDV